MSTVTGPDGRVPEMVPVSPLAWRPLDGPEREPWRWAAIAVAMVGILVFASTYVHLPYFIESPGSAEAVNIRVQPPGRPHSVNGSILLSTVALQTNVDPFEIVTSWFKSDEHVVRQQEVTGGASPTQFVAQNTTEMDQSQEAAIVVALRRLGYPVPERGDGVIVAGVSPLAPADGRLRPGDVVVSADNRRVLVARDLVTAIKKHTPGSKLHLTYDRPNQAEQTTDITVGPCPTALCGATGSDQSYLGVSLQTRNERFDFPFKVEVVANGIGGPSAGLAFALGVINTLTTGNITGGHKVAVTGTIGLDGKVGPIGGIALKTVAVEREGADYFLVPKDDGIPGDEAQYSAAAAKARGHHLKVIAVGTLDDALNALRSIGGNFTGIGPPPPAPRQ